MVNTTSKRKRKSHNNRTRLSRRVKRGGGWFSWKSTPKEPIESTITNENQYLAIYNELKTAYTLTDEEIKSGRFSATDDATRQIILSLLHKLNTYKVERLVIYRKLLQDSKPEYPYARNQTTEDIKSIKEKADKEKELAKREAEEARRPVHVSRGEGGVPWN